MIFGQEKNETFLEFLTGCGTGHSILYAQFFKRRAKFHQLIFLYCENLKFFLYSAERGKHYAQKRWFKNDDAYCGSDVHIIHT